MFERQGVIGNDCASIWERSASISLDAPFDGAFYFLEVFKVEEKELIAKVERSGPAGEN